MTSTPIGPGPIAAPGADVMRFKGYFTEAQQITAESRADSLNALDYYDSDQFTREQLAELQRRKQPPLVINRIKPAINGILGITEKGRSDPVCWPRNPDDTDSADVATDVLRYICTATRFKRLKQDCFKDLLVPGSMAALVGVDNDKQVTVTQIRWEEFFYDPRSRRPDFQDSRYLGIAKWMYVDDAAALYPDKARAIESAVNSGGQGGLMAPGASAMDRPVNAAGSPGVVWIDPNMRRLMVCEIYYREHMQWRRAVFTGSDVLEDGPSPYLDHKGRPDCPIEAQSAYVKRDNARYGAVHDMIGPQDETNRRRSKSMHLLSVTQLEASDPSAIGVSMEDEDRVRREAARPDGIIPFGWRKAPNTAEFEGNIQMLQEAKGEIERLGPNPAVLGRTQTDDSGRALLARQQAGLVELAPLFGALEDWELRIYRKMWARAKQFWTAPQFIRVTDDNDSPKFVGLNQPIVRGPPVAGVDPATGAPTFQPGILGYKNALAEMDVDIEIDSQPENATVEQEAFNDLMRLVSASPIYQQQVPLHVLVQLSPIPHKRSLLDAIKQASDEQAQQNQAAQALNQAMGEAKLGHVQAQTQELEAKVPLHGATAFAKASDAMTYAHATHAAPLAAGLAAGMSHQQALNPPPVDSDHAMEQSEMAPPDADADGQ